MSHLFWLMHTEFSMYPGRARQRYRYFRRYRHRACCGGAPGEQQALPIALRNALSLPGDRLGARSPGAPGPHGLPGAGRRGRRGGEDQYDDRRSHLSVQTQRGIVPAQLRHQRGAPSRSAGRCDRTRLAPEPCIWGPHAERACRRCCSSSVLRVRCRLWLSQPRPSRRSVWAPGVPGPQHFTTAGAGLCG